mgnify:CR=1 FL=1
MKAGLVAAIAIVAALASSSCGRRVTIAPDRVPLRNDTKWVIKKTPPKQGEAPAGASQPNEIVKKAPK